MGESERKTSWQMSEASGRVTPYSMQHFLGRSNWDADTAIREPQILFTKYLGDSQSVFILDETGFIKRVTNRLVCNGNTRVPLGGSRTAKLGYFVRTARQKAIALLPEDFFANKLGQR